VHCFPAHAHWSRSFGCAGGGERRRHPFGFGGSLGLRGHRCVATVPQGARRHPRRCRRRRSGGRERSGRRIAAEPRAGARRASARPGSSGGPRSSPSRSGAAPS
jgi:hypothetical protein